ncbi:MAG: glutaminyl-peptide cyclotransferase [Ferruginibacter sp.]
MKYLISISFLLFLAACDTNNDSPPADNGGDATPNVPASGLAAPKPISYTIISEFPHDTSSFTEGLEFYNGKLYESGGEYGTSKLQYGDHKKGVPADMHKLEDKIFAEGLTILKDKIYQLSYREHVVYVYDVKDIKKVIKTFNWPYEGWGMTNNGTDLIIDTGTPNLIFVDPENFKIKNTIAVVDNRGPVQNINELEFINGFVWANVWMTNRIVKIDPESGHVVGDMYLNNIATPEGEMLSHGFDNSDVLNGIAYDSLSKSLFITGKRWPKLYEVKTNE